MTATTPQEDLRLDAVGALTSAARRTDDHGDPADFADFLANVLASVAANLGGSDRLLVGRSGSWEASLVEDLILGTVGDEPADLYRFRTEPISVPINVAELIENSGCHPGLIGLEDAFDEICDRYASGNGDDDSAAYEWDAAATIDRYTVSYRTYGAAFATAAGDAAEEAGLDRAWLVVTIDDDPRSRWWAEETTRNPDQWEADEMVLQLWSRAHDVVRLPNVDIRRAAAETAREAEDHD